MHVNKFLCQCSKRLFTSGRTCLRWPNESAMNSTWCSRQDFATKPARPSSRSCHHGGKIETFLSRCSVMCYFEGNECISSDDLSKPLFLRCQSTLISMRLLVDRCGKHLLLCLKRENVRNQRAMFSSSRPHHDSITASASCNLEVNV